MRTEARIGGVLVVVAAAATTVLLDACVGDDPGFAPSTAPDAAPPNTPGTSDGDGGGGVEEDAGPCVPGLGCTPAKLCKKGRVSCDTGRSTCVEIDNVLDGTSCGATTICRGGACEDPAWALWPMPSWPDAPTGPIPSYSFESSSEGATTRDSVTNLSWLTGGPTPRTWAEAKKYCEDLDRYGFADWRLPTVIEVVSLGDPTRASGLPGRLGGVTSGLWTSTPVAGADGSHWSVSNVMPKRSLDNAAFDVRCVR